MLRNLYKSISLTLALTLIFLPVRGFALPEGGTMAAGTGNIPTVNAGDTAMTITQTSDRMIADYTSFNILNGESVTFAQHLNTDIALNRINDANPSQILGALTANGRIFLINPNGIVFGAGSQINAAGLLASTLTMDKPSTTAFMAGVNTFSFYAVDNKAGSVINAGTLNSPGGFIALLAPSVRNSGYVYADVGSIMLATGNAITVALDPLSRVSTVTGDPGDADAAIINTGTLQAKGGKVLLNGAIINTLLKNSVNNSGIIEAKEIEIAGNGNIELQAGSQVKAQSDDSNASVDIESYGGDVGITGSQVSASTKNSGTSTNVYIRGWSPDSNIDIADSDVHSEVGGNGYAYLNIVAGAFYGDDATLMGGAIHISDGSDILSDVAGFGGAFANLEAGGAAPLAPSSVIVNDSTVSAYVDGGWAEVDIVDGNHSRNVAYEDSENWYQDEKSYGGHVELNGSTVIAGVRNSDSPNGSAEVIIKAGDIILDNTDVTASISGSGDTEVDVYGLGEYSKEWGYVDGEYFENYYYSLGGTVDIRNGSNVLAETNHGDAEVSIQTGADPLYLKGEEGPVEVPSFINVSDGSTIIADVNGLGHAGVYFGSGYSEIDLSLIGDFLGMFGVDIEDALAMADITPSDLGGGPVYGPIYITGGSTIHAESQGPIDDTVFGTAVVAIASADYLDIVDSTISASDPKMAGVALYAGSEGDIDITGSSNISATTTDENSIAGVVAMAGYEIGAGGTITADGGAGFGVVGMLAGAGLEADNVIARGKGDVMPVLEGLLSKYYGGLYKNASLEIKSPFTYGSGILLASEHGDITLGNLSADAVLADTLGGSIYDLGDINSRLTILLARNDIGTLEAPIRTNTDILAAYSFDQGDIAVDEANDLQLGLVLPVTLHDSENGTLEAILGMAVAANNGNIFIRSQGDMLVDSVMAPNGGVFLQSVHGSIYAGKGWDPFLSSSLDLARVVFNVDYLKSLYDDVGYAPIVFTYADPEFSGTPYNLVAGGYSYLSAPEGTIGVGTPDKKDPAISGEILGNVYPVVRGVTDEFGPGIDLSRYTPQGLVYYTGIKVDPQIWPETITDPAITSGNPLKVFVDASITGDTRMLPAWFVNTLPVVEGSPDLSNVAGLTLEIGLPSQLPPVNPNDNSGLLANALQKNLRAYYEIMSGTRFQSMEPVTPTNFFGYHPLTPMDMSAFDGIRLDVGAYDFISNNIKTKKPLAPYFGP